MSTVEYCTSRSNTMVVWVTEKTPQLHVALRLHYNHDDGFGGRAAVELVDQADPLTQSPNIEQPGKN